MKSIAGWWLLAATSQKYVRQLANQITPGMVANDQIILKPQARLNSSAFDVHIFPLEQVGSYRR